VAVSAWHSRCELARPDSNRGKLLRKLSPRSWQPPPVNENGPENITSWNARISGVGDPYLDRDPVLQQAARRLTELRSASER
jgi:hypothetical protein